VTFDASIAGNLSDADLFNRVLTAEHDAGGKAKWPIPAGWETGAMFGGEGGDADGDCYRYKLWHRWGEGPMALIGMMNPSTATPRLLDPTVAKTARIFKRLGFGGQFIANACAYRATDKRRLLDVADPVGPLNNYSILQMAVTCDMVVIAHGRLPGDLQKHAVAMCHLLLGVGHELHVLRLTDDGCPVHPLARGKAHIPEDVVPQPWTGPGYGAGP
jgi:hypothetical protein